MAGQPPPARLREACLKTCSVCKVDVTVLVRVGGPATGGGRLFFWCAHSVMQYLARQAHHFTHFRIDGQAVLADVTSTFSVADLPKITRQRKVIGVIQFGGVMKNQNRAPHLLNGLQSAFSMRRKTLRNGLRGLVDEAGFGQAGIDGGRRPETLSPAEFGALAATPAPPVAV